MDRFDIGVVEKFINRELEDEISDITKVIKSMIKIKDNKDYVTIKRYRPYSIEDKIKLNRLSTNTATKITKYHNENFDLIDEAIDLLSSYEYSIIEDLFDFYESIYIDVLDELEIDCDNNEDIKVNSNKIYKIMTKEIREQIYEGKKTDIPSNKIKTYIESITAYVFYKCRFLIPIEGIS